MRPRVFPAEDHHILRQSALRAPAASMRPRVFPAEDRHGAAVVHRVHAASMRPRVFPAEDARRHFNLRRFVVLQ